MRPETIGFLYFALDLLEAMNQRQCVGNQVFGIDSEGFKQVRADILGLCEKANREVEEAVSDRNKSLGLLVRYLLETKKRGTAKDLARIAKECFGINIKWNRTKTSIIGKILEEVSQRDHKAYHQFLEKWQEFQGLPKRFKAKKDLMDYWFEFFRKNPHG